jgi:hypothetical protein
MKNKARSIFSIYINEMSGAVICGKQRPTDLSFSNLATAIKPFIKKKKKIGLEVWLES